MKSSNEAAAPLVERRDSIAALVSGVRSRSECMSGRRHFIAVLSAGILAGALPAAAQERKPRRIGILFRGGLYDAGVQGLRDGLAAAGLRDGSELTFLIRETKDDLRSVEAVARE